MKRLVLLLLVFAFACGRSTPAPKKALEPALSLVTVTNISRVLMHEPGHFTFLVDQPNDELGQLEIVVSVGTTRMLRDVKDDKPTFITFYCTKLGIGWSGFESEKYRIACEPQPINFESLHFSVDSLTIHLHSGEEVNGAGWRRVSMPPSHIKSGNTLVLK